MCCSVISLEELRIREGEDACEDAEEERRVMAELAEVLSDVGSTTLSCIDIIYELMDKRMYPLTLDGIGQAIKALG